MDVAQLKTSHSSNQSILNFNSSAFFSSILRDGACCREETYHGF